MDQWLAEFLSNVPLVLAFLIVVYLMARQITEREERRDAAFANIEQGREQARSAAQERQDRQIDQMLAIQQTQQGLQKELAAALGILNDTIRAVGASMVSLEENGGTRHDQVMTALSGVGADTAAILDALKTMDAGKSEILAAVEKLFQVMTTHQAPDATLTDEMAKLTNNVLVLKDQVQRLADQITDAITASG